MRGTGEGDPPDGTLHAAGVPLVVPFAVLAAVGGAVALVLTGSAPTLNARGQTGHVPDRTERPRLRPPAPLLVLGGLGALAFAVENGHQSWSALYVRDVLHGGPTTAGMGPATFAAVVAITRLTTAGLGVRHPLLVLCSGAILAAVGTTTLAAATTVGCGLLGLGVAAAGTAVLFPTLLNVLTTQTSSETRGRATSVVTTVAYLGFLGGPAYVGLWAEAIDLPGAMAALAALAVVLVVLSPLALRPGRPIGDRPGSRHPGLTDSPSSRDSHVLRIRTIDR